MASIQIELPEPENSYVAARVEYGEFSSASELVRTLIREDRARRMAALEDELEAAMNSGDIEVTPEELIGGNLIAVLKERSSQPRR